jgi:NADH-quinone oxidoreductase subunit E
MTTAARATSTKPLLKEYGSAKRDSLIPILQKAQEVHGYLSEEAIAEIGRHLKLPASKVYGVATFYNQFRFAPKGTHVIEVCRGTACHVKQSLKLAQHLTRKLNLKPNGNSPDNKFTIITVACLGACSIAPVIKLDGEFYGHLDVEKLDRLLDEAVKGEIHASK